MPTPQTSLAAAFEAQLASLERLGPSPGLGGRPRIHHEHVAAGDLLVVLPARQPSRPELEGAASRGCAAVALRPEDRHLTGGLPITTFLCDDPLALWGRLAAAYRAIALSMPVVAITGSMGKTTVKELCLAATAGAGTLGNQNNLESVPFTLLGIPPSAPCAVLELGTNARGEIARLAAIVAPTIAVLTTIAPAHLEAFGSLDGVAAQKGALLDATDPSGAAVLNADEPRVVALRRRFRGSRVLWTSASGLAHADLAVTRVLHSDARSLAARVRVFDREHELELGLPGVHNLGNALAAIGAAIAAGVEVERALDRLRRARPTSMRFEVHRVGGRTLIDDSYNANPASVRASVASALELSQLRPLVVCLGDLAELGPDAGAHHAELGRWLAQQGVHRVLATGERTRALVDAARSEGLPTAEHLPDPLALVERAREATPDGGMCLVKGSRVAEMERVAISLRAEWARGLGWRERLRVRAACVCGCGFDEVDGGLADLLEQLEERLGAPLPLTSVCRCARHNEAVGGDDASPHTRGLAADLACRDDRLRQRIVTSWIELLAAHNRRPDAALVPVRVELGPEHVHLDVDRHLPPRLWFAPPTFVDLGNGGRAPAAPLTIGVTGTNGKTTTTTLLAAALRTLGRSTLAVTTVGSFLDGQALPDADRRASWEQRLAELGARGGAAALELTSDALANGLAERLRCRIAVFTNLSRDHLHSHGTVERYLAAKAELFLHLPTDTDARDLPGTAVLNGCDPACALLEEVLPPGTRVLRYGLRARGAPYAPLHLTGEVELGWRGTTVALESRDLPTALAECRTLRTRAVGEVHAENALAAFLAALAAGVSATDAARAIAEEAPPPGRFERIAHAPVVVVDYAHSPDALRRTLSSARALCTGRLWVVVGAGGQRDVGKRSAMGRAAGLADEVIFTTDNPRGEDPAEIARHLASGLPAGRSCRIELDRRRAIALAIQVSSEVDLVVLAGRGHEAGEAADDPHGGASDADLARIALAERQTAAAPATHAVR